MESNTASQHGSESTCCTTNSIAAEVLVPTPAAAFPDAGASVSCETPSAQTERTKALSKTSLRKKDKSLNAFFSLPEEEECIDQFSCALKSRILLHGHLYIFKQSLAFHSNIFGYVKTRVLPLKDVTLVRKRKLYGLPNALEIMCRGKAEVYTSFINRKEAYALIMECWQQCSDYAKLFGEQSGEMSVPSTPDTHHTSIQQHHQPQQQQKTEAGSQGTTQAAHKQETTAAERDQADVQSTASRFASASLHGWPAEQPPAASEPDSSKAGAGSSPEGQAQRPGWDIEQGSPPPVPEGMIVAAEGTWPCSVSEALDRIFSDASGFFREWHEKRGDANVRLGSWGHVLGQAVGHVRELQFDQPMTGALKGLPMAPKVARCLQTQRLRLFPEDHLVFETTQMMTGIPMADSFKVEARWDLAPCPTSPTSCQVHTHMAVPFTKSSLWKGLIERTTQAAVKEANADFIAKAAERAAGARPPAMIPLLSSGEVPRRMLSTTLTRRGSTTLHRRLHSTRLSRDGLLHQAPSRSLDANRTLQQAAQPRTSEADAGDLIQKASSAYRSDFLRVLRAGLDAEAAATASSPHPGESPFSMRAMRPSFQPDLDGGAAPTSAMASLWGWRLPSLSRMLLGSAVLLLILLQVIILWKIGGSGLSSGSAAKPAALDQSAFLMQQLAQMQMEITQLRSKLAKLEHAQ